MSVAASQTNGGNGGPPTSSPQWDSRNTGFISPTRLQQMRKQSPVHQFSLQPDPSADSTVPPPQPTPQGRPGSAGSPAQHGRSSSFFSFRTRSSTEPAATLTKTRSNEFGQMSPRMQQQQQQTAQPQPQQQARPPPAQQGPPQPPQLHPEIRSVVQLTVAHAHKVYFSGPMVRRIERQPDGHPPAKDEGWKDVWGQLGGTTLSVWDMQEIEEANKHGREVPPTYINITDAFVQVLSSVTIPATPSQPARRFTNVLTLNTAGSNLLLFSCPSPEALISWASAFRLSAWEKSRLEEIYTAHLIRITLPTRDAPSTLIRGRMEGWVRIRVSGQTDWKRVWMVISSSADAQAPGEASSITSGQQPPTARGKKRMSNLFSREQSPPRPVGPVKPTIHMYPGQKHKDRKKPLLTMTNVSQAFAVYPERPELISRSTLMKVEGLLGDEEMGMSMRRREGWLLVMPESETGVGQASEMLKWIIALHDAFELYGRPPAWTWDPRDPASLMFAYPVGQHKDTLFLDREAAEAMDPREDRTSVIRSRLLNILIERMRAAGPPGAPGPSGPAGGPMRPSLDAPPSLPPIGELSSDGAGSSSPRNPPGQSPSLPPLNFDAPQQSNDRDRAPLTPITETSSVQTHARSMSGTEYNLNHRTSLNMDQMMIPEESSHSQQSSQILQSQQLHQSPQSQHQPLDSAARSVADSLGRRPSARSSFFAGQSSNTPPSSPPMQQLHDMPHTNGDQARSMSPQSAANRSVASGSPKPLHQFSPQVSSKPLPPKDDGPPITTVTVNTSRPGAYSRPSYDHGSPSRPPAGEAIHRPASPSSSTRSTPTSLNRMQGQATSPMLRSPYSPQSQESQHAHAQEFGMTPAPVGRTLKDAPMPTQPAPEPAPQPNPPSSDEGGYGDLSGALSYMRQNQEAESAPSHVRPGLSKADSATSATSPSVYSTDTSRERVAHVAADRAGSPSRQAPLGRKPSGARAQPSSARSPISNVPHRVSEDEDEEEAESDASSNDHAHRNTKPAPAPAQKRPNDLMAGSQEDGDLDVIAALSYLDTNDDEQDNKPVAAPEPAPTPAAASPVANVSPLRPKNASSPPPGSPPQEGAKPPAHYRSSFAPSKHAAERKAKLEAEKAAQYAAAHKPGRANGKRRSKAGAWNDSSDEEEDEEEEEEDDEDADSDAPPPSTKARPPRGAPPSLRGGPSSEAHSQSGEGGTTPSHLRPPRTLPQPPPGRHQEEEWSHPNGSNTNLPLPPQLRPRTVSNQFTGTQYYEDGTPILSQAEAPVPGQARQTVWSQVLDPGRLGNGQPPPGQGRDTFVQMEPPAQAMTKAFTPHGLLSAGLQDREDRSAKRQELLAREAGASLVNVPNKPPPPQTGLLGAVSAHERERKRDGGIGATLTEREREKRAAEERQRRFEEQQRQQMEQMGPMSMYGNQFGMNPMMMGMNPMMMGMNPMMTGAGMNPMMTGGGMMNPMMTGGSMMGGYNPAQMFAAQQAAQAYQQAMMAFSTAGSQAGDAPQGQQPAMGQMGQMGAMGNFDPRMSMMGMPMMGMAMGGGMGMGGMGMQPQMSGMGGMQGPLMPQMSGMSQFNPHFTPVGTPSGMGDPSGLVPPDRANLGNSSRSRSNSPAPSPLGAGSRERSPARASSPKN